MSDARDALVRLLDQLAIADHHAREDNPSKVASLWQIQNSHLRDRANEALAALSQVAPVSPAGVEAASLLTSFRRKDLIAILDAAPQQAQPKGFRSLARSDLQDAVAIAMVSLPYVRDIVVQGARQSLCAGGDTSRPDPH